MARPRKEIDQKEFEKLCGLQCTKEEICGWFDLTDKTLERWCKETYNAGFSEVFRIKRGIGKISLRRLQFQLAEKNAAMCIWLGKQYLGQKEPKDEIDIRVLDIPTNIDDLTDEEVEKLYKEHTSRAKT